ncbi:TonB-dependent receptor [Stenotrophomonas maltophilia]|uniref:TonB-dependent receptor n=1 Tax=Stenotrophomonas maltophilia TaxID=40324 RepID=UPI0019D48C01|nr:TonB-dependent receptor [Stenotrophomonas maltophilia]MBN7830495.1 TonB-dependent receptor [Stenotrophomonas maltophilia]MBN7833528.1 TonB-dependent receptor [Stenotrophomonas maltophilia]MBN7859598.1 TonB-dependent receptor [Stenotrophomonas maltophilia]MBN7916368.1 TonB-dependent receptor [Stenotrophomonas maltophilia]MBO2846721.1 TonB-dependent receptor [Stenotrophomonas maltophilia]
MNHRSPAYHPLTLALASALLLAPIAARAEAPASGDPATTLDTVVVSGYRQSVERASDLKREAAVQRDSIVADDIASFPDTNLAESLQRIPGVAITRDAGEGRQISLRGLGPEFTRVRLNGMDALSTSGSIDSRGGTNRSRGFDFNIFASELFNRIDVTKSGDARVGEGGLAGTVDLHTPRPFDFPGYKFAASAGGLYQENSEKTSPRTALLLSNTFADGRFGALFSAAYSRRQTVEYGDSNVRWASGGWNLANVSPDIDPALVARLNSSGDDKLFYPRFDRYDVYDYDQKRVGLTGALQFQASDNVLLSLDLAHGRMRSSRDEYHIDASSFSRTNALGQYNTGIRETTIKELAVEGNTIVYGDYGNVDLRSDTHQDRATTTYRQAVLSMQADASDRLRIDAMAGFQDSSFDNPQDNNLFFFSQNRDFSIDYRGNSRMPVQTYGMDINDPSNYFLDIIRLRHGQTRNRLGSTRVDLDFVLSDALTLKGGLDAHSQTFSSAYWSSDFTDQRFRSVADISTGLPHNFASGAGVAGLPAGWLAADLDTAWSTLGASNYTPARDYGSSWSVKEKPVGAYAQLEFDTELGGLRWRGNLGVRYVRTALESSGFVGNGSGGFDWVTLKRHYDDVLPSFNSALELRDDLVWRLGLSRNMTRPSLASLAPNGAVNSLNRTVSVGNPNLDPFRADAIDTSLEWYFDQGAMLAVAGFYKKIDSFIISTINEMSYTASGYPLSLLNQSVVTPDQSFSFTQPVNGRGTNLKGAEISYQQGLTFLPGPLDKLGVQVNYTWADARMDVDTGGGKIVNTLLPGLSRNTVNGTIYWENERLSARVSATYRDRYLTAVPGGNGNDVAGVNASTYVDASLQYRFRPGWALVLQGNNLTDEADDQFVDSSNRVYNYTKAGRQYFVGLRVEL